MSNFADRTPLNLALALELADQGIPVFPVAAGGPAGKKPLTEHGYLDATTDHEQLRSWFISHPTALAAYPTSANTTVVVDVDGPHGLAALAALCASLGIEDEATLTPVRVRTPSGGLHLHFRLRDGEVFRNRASDIAPGLDTRGVKEDGVPAGYIIAPGNRLPDGRCYAHIGESHEITDAAFVPSRLLYLATFNRAQRTKIKSTPELLALIRDNYPADWCALYAEFVVKEHAAVLRRLGPPPAEGLERQARADLDEAAAELAALRDGRCNGLYFIPCRVSKYVALGALPESAFRAGFMAAAGANGSLAKPGKGTAWAHGVLTRALAAGRNDTAPPIARRFREVTE